MKSRRTYSPRGFTLIELLIVISIIILMAGMTVPSMSRFMRQRDLKNGARLVQMIFAKARSEAIAQREEQYVVFFVKDASTGSEFSLTTKGTKDANTAKKTGTKGQIHHYDPNENSAAADQNKQVGTIEDLGKNVEFSTPATTFQVTFYPDGTVSSSSPDQTGDPDAADGSNDASYDLVIKQVGAGNKQKCYIDFIQNTARVRFAIYTP